MATDIVNVEKIRITLNTVYFDRGKTIPSTLRWQKSGGVDRGIYGIY